MTDRYELAREADKFAARFNTAGDSEMSIQDWFMLAWARDIPDLKPMPYEGIILNLGAGHRLIGDSIPLDLERGWNADYQNLPYRDCTVSGIWAHGFFEHLSGDVAIHTLHECQRVLVPGGVLNIVVPHAMAEMYPEDITHKSLWHEATITNIMNNPYYNNGHKHQWMLRQHACFIMGVVWRNLGLFYQLVREA